MFTKGSCRMPPGGEHSRHGLRSQKQQPYISSLLWFIATSPFRCFGSCVLRAWRSVCVVHASYPCHICYVAKMSAFPWLAAIVLPCHVNFARKKRPRCFEHHYGTTQPPGKLKRYDTDKRVVFHHPVSHRYHLDDTFLASTETWK